VVAAIGMALGSHAYVEAIGTAVLVVLVLHGLGFVEVYLARQVARTRLTIHARPEAIEEIMDAVRRTGLDIITCTRRQEAGPDAILEVEVRGLRRLHAQVMTALIHHPAVRSVSTGE